MIWSQTVFALILGVIVSGPWQQVQSEKFFNLKTRNSTHHGRAENKTQHYSTVKPAVVDNALYMKYACQGKQNGLRLPIEDSCTQYLECQKNSAKLMTCKDGKHFSTFSLACIDANLSKCTMTCECCGKQDGLYPDVKNCSNFVVCVEEKAHQLSCGNTLKFNADKRMCDIPQRAKCDDISNHTLIQTKPLPNNTITPMYMVSYKVCQNKSNGYNVGVAGSCNKFYICINGKGYLKSCGSMQFNSENHFCDPRTRILCPEFEENEVIFESDEDPFINEIPKPWLRPVMPIPPVPVPMPRPPHKKPALPHEVIPNHPPIMGELEHPPMPHHPHEHLPHHPHEIPKPPVVTVDPVSPVPPVTTTVIPNDVEESIDPELYAGLCADQSIGALIAMPRYCNKYIRCRWDWYERRVAELESCPKNMHFNSKSKLCEKPEQAGCLVRLN